MEPTAPVVETNPYGLEALWNNGGPIAQATLIILLAQERPKWFLASMVLFALPVLEVVTVASCTQVEPLSQRMRTVSRAA